MFFILSYVLCAICLVFDDAGFENLKKLFSLFNTFISLRKIKATIEVQCFSTFLLLKDSQYVIILCNVVFCCYTHIIFIQYIIF